jgi:hypothetical protein
MIFFHGRFHISKRWLIREKNIRSLNEEEKQEYNSYLYWKNCLLINWKKQTNETADYENLD